MVRLGLWVALFSLAAPVHAWSAQGHMASGAIAFDRISTEDPAVIDRVRRIMAAHPDRSRFEAALGHLAGPARDRMLFELMARWPDDVVHTRFGHPKWHYEVRVVSGWRLFGPLRFGDAEPAFNHNLAIAKDEKVSLADRAVALCWVFHIVGDMHQPLHAGHRMSGRFPATDRAGSIAWVRRAADQAPVTLHAFWDRAADLPGPLDAATDTIAREAETIVAPDSVTPTTAPPEAQFQAWMRESEKLAADIAYQGAGLTASAQQNKAPPLPPPYVREAQSLAERRLGQAGIRLARLVERILPEPVRH